MARQAGRVAENKQLQKSLLKRKIIRALSIIVTILSLAVVGMGAYTYSYFQRAISDPGSAFKNVLEGFNEPKKNDDPKNPPPAAIPEGLKFNTDVVPVLLVGVDTGYDYSSGTVRKENVQGYNSDTLVVMLINTKENTASLLSIPRDTYARINLLNARGQKTGEKYGKINSAYSNGGGRTKSSYNNALDAVQDLLFGSDTIDHVPFYVGINMDSVPKIVNMVGGVPITIDADFSKFGMNKGQTMTLNGQQAMIYVRERHLPGTDGGDIGRTKRQLRFLKALAGVVKTKSATQILGLYNQAMPYMDTNLSNDQVMALAVALRKIDLDAMEMHTLPGSVSGGYYRIDQAQTQELLEQLIYIKK